MAILIDEPGGLLDSLAGHPDVTTFLNDRFHPMFFSDSTPAQPTPVTLLLDASGCLLAAPITATEATIWLQAVNAAALAHVDRGPAPIRGDTTERASSPHGAGMPGGRPNLAVPLHEFPQDHPLRRPCRPLEDDGP